MNNDFDYLSAFNEKRRFKFYKKVNYHLDHDECWTWLGSCDSKGRGKMTIRINNFNKTLIAPRIMYALDRNVNIKSNQFVCHYCDNARCVNPKHLYLGDNSTNQKDAYNDKRSGLLKLHGKEFKGANKICGKSMLL